MYEDGEIKKNTRHWSGEWNWGMCFLKDDFFLFFYYFFIYNLIYATYYSCWSRANQVKIARDILFLLIPGTANTVTPRAKKMWWKNSCRKPSDNLDNLHSRQSKKAREFVYICVSNSFFSKIIRVLYFLYRHQTVHYQVN